MIYVAIYIGGRLSLDYLAGGVSKIDRNVHTCIPVYTASYHRNHCYLDYTATSITTIATFSLKWTKKFFSSHCIVIRTFEKQSTGKVKVQCKAPHSLFSYTQNYFLKYLKP